MGPLPGAGGGEFRETRQYEFLPSGVYEGPVDGVESDLPRIEVYARSPAAGEVDQVDGGLARRGNGADDLTGRWDHHVEEDFYCTRGGFDSGGDRPVSVQCDVCSLGLVH